MSDDNPPLNDDVPQWFSLDNTDEALDPMAEALREAIRNQYDLDDSIDIYPMKGSFDVSEERFEVAALLVDDDGEGAYEIEA